MEITLDTWIISDTHFGHLNIVRYQSRPENHDELMVERWNERIGEDDDVLHLGDIFLGPKSDASELLLKLKGRKYYLRANHDRQSANWYAEYGFISLGKRVAWRAPNNDDVLFSHEPSRDYGWKINIHGHIHKNGYPPDVDMNRDYRNVSVEVMDYRPWRLRDVLSGGKFQSPADAGMNEYEIAKSVSPT